MMDLIIPIPNSGNTDTIEVNVKIDKKKICYGYKIESFPWLTDDNDTNNSLSKIDRLKEIVKNYNYDWELLKIYTSPPNSKYIQILFRQRKIKD